MKIMLKTISRTGLIAATSILLFAILAVPAFAQEIPGKDKAGMVFIILLILAIPEILAMSALTLIWRGLFPKRLDWTGSIVRRLSWSSFWFGLLSMVILCVLGALFAQFSDAMVLPLLIIFSAYAIMFASFGKIAVIEWAGEVVDPSSTGLRRAVLGVTALYLLLFILVFGWLLLLGLVFMGIGAAIYSWLPTRKIEQPSPPADQESSLVSN